MREFPEFILASRSPRRRDLLTRAHYRFRVVAPALPEPETPSMSPAPTQLAEALAYFKARAVQVDCPDDIVLGADTVVAHEGHIYGKAADADEARQILAALSGSKHEVITAIAVLLPARPAAGEAGPRRVLAAETTHIHMRDLSDEEIGLYVASGEWRDKAGAYAVQETGDAFIDHIDGSYSNVVGLPIELVEQLCIDADILDAIRA